MHEITTKIYLFKEEFCKQLKISNYIFDRRREDLLEWLKNFYDYELLEGKPLHIVIKEVIGEYRPLPRKAYDSKARETLQQEKKKDYEEFTIKALGDEFKPNSKSKIAREAIAAFGDEKYGHYSKEGVVRRYIREPFDTYGETNNNNLWVYYSSYRPLESDVLQEWRTILTEERIDEAEAANAFYRQAQGENIDKEINYFKKALERFKTKYHDTPIRVKEWRKKDTTK